MKKKYKKISFKIEVSELKIRRESTKKGKTMDKDKKQKNRNSRRKYKQNKKIED
jgi:hypothetical protein